MSTKTDDNQITDPQDELVGLIKEFRSVKKEVISAFRSDRDDIDKYIRRFSNRIKDPDKAKQVYVEGITSLLATKANTGANIIRVLDSITKVVSATKNHKGFEAGGSDNANLSELLREVEVSEGEYDPNDP